MYRYKAFTTACFVLGRYKPSISSEARSLARQVPTIPPAFSSFSSHFAHALPPTLPAARWAVQVSPLAPQLLATSNGKRIKSRQLFGVGAYGRSQIPPAEVNIRR